MIESIQMTDQLLIARWIMNADAKDDYKLYYLKGWMSGKWRCYQFKEGKSSVGWILCHNFADTGVFIDFISIRNNKVVAVFEAMMRQHNVTELRMTTDRPKAWGRLMGWETLTTIMKKEI
jgi:hypothetical protein